jgi:hypothetical protein
MGGERFKTESVDRIEQFEIMRTIQGEETLSFIKTRSIFWAKKTSSSRKLPLEYQQAIIKTKTRKINNHFGGLFIINIRQ